MASLDFGGGSEDKQKNHKCTSEQEGEWIVFRCDLCPDYERRMHIKTGKMVTKGGNEESNILHNGFFVRPGFDYQPN